MSGANEAGALAYQKMRDDPESCVEAGLLPGYSKPRAEDCKSGGAEIGGLAESAADAALVAYAAEPAALGRTGAFHVDWWRYYTKAFASNACTFAIMLVGIAMKAAGIVTGTRWVLAAGVFGFAGGITNWIAVHMLFEKVPGLYGSGVIPMRFKEIRETVKDTMMRTFFDSDYLERYMRSKMSALGEGEDGLALQAELQRMLSTPAFERLIEEQLEGLKAKPEGLLLAMQGIEPRTLKPVVMAFVKGAASDLGPMLATLDPAAILPVDRLRAEIEKLMTTKLQELTPERVRALLEEVIRVHLGWLVVWGNVFGALIGLVSTALGYP